MTENIAEIIREAHGPTGEMADLARKAQRLSRALRVAEKWEEVATSDAEMYGRAQIAHDQLEEELSRTVFEMDALYNERLWAQGRKEREASPEDVEHERARARDSAISDALLACYCTLGTAPLEAFGVGDRAAEERTRYELMGALMAAVDALRGKEEPEEKATV